MSTQNSEPPALGSGRLVGRRVTLAVKTLRAYEERVTYWLTEATKYRRATHARREAVAYANAFSCIVDDLRALVPAKDRQPPSNIESRDAKRSL